MPPAPLVAAALLGLGAMLGSIGLGVDPDPFTQQAALLIAVGGGILTVTTVAGVLLARGRWSRWMSIVVSAGWFATALTGTIRAIDIATMTATVAVATVAAGPWLNRWLRRLPSATAPPPSAALVLLLLLATPTVAGATSRDVETLAAAWLLSGWSLTVAFGLARAMAPALWTLRTVHLPIAVAAGLVMGMPAGMVLAAKAAVETFLAWRRDLHLAVSPLVPERSPVVAIPPELVNPAIMEAIGLDDRGRPLEKT